MPQAVSSPHATTGLAAPVGMGLPLPAQLPADLRPARTAVTVARPGAKAALGYAYLQILATRAGFGCCWISQHTDGCGVNARLDIRERLDPQARLTEFSLDFQLKANSRRLPVTDNKVVFSLEVERYEGLRAAPPERPQFIALLSLPQVDDVSAVSAEELIVQRSGRWLCLSGAPPASNAPSVAVGFPTWNVLTPATLREIARRVALGSRFYHEQ